MHRKRGVFFSTCLMALAACSNASLGGQTGNGPGNPSGTVCEIGYTGENCASCADGYQRSGDLCVASSGQQPGVFLNGFFPIGVFVPPEDDFDKWKERGVNTLVMMPNGWETPYVWDAKGREKGFRQIRAPIGNDISNEDLSKQDILAWAQPDEPDAGGIPNNSNAPLCAPNYAAWKAADPNRPVYINFGGSDVADPAIDLELYKPLIAAADWISNDLYPFGGYLSGSKSDRREDITLLGEPIDILRELSHGKPQFAYIETSKMDPNLNQVNRDALRGEIWEVIIHGVRGFVYFPEFHNGDFVWDDTTPELAEELTIQNEKITRLAAVLQGPIDPLGVSVAADAPFEVAWRTASSGKYFIVLNPTPNAINGATVTFTGIGNATSAAVFDESRSVPVTDGKLADDFGKYAVHIYVVQ